MPISNDPNDLCGLTPGHFLIGRHVAIFEKDLVAEPLNRLNKGELIKQAQQSFCKRWSNEYLPT